MDTDLPLVSVICCGLLDADALSSFHGDLFAALRPLESAHRFEVLYVVDSGRLDVLARMNALAQLDPRLRVVATPAGPRADEPAQVGLRRATGDLIITLQAAMAPGEVLPKFLEAAKNSCSIAFAGRDDSACLLLKRQAADAVLAAHDGRKSLRELALATGLACIEIPLAPRQRSIVPRAAVPVVETRAVPTLSGWRDRVLAWVRDPFELITYFGLVVLAIGVFLACWFPVQGLFAPGSVWFSWCYLIVLLHVLGGSILFALGKVGILAQRIGEEPSSLTAPEDKVLLQQPGVAEPRRAA